MDGEGDEVEHQQHVGQAFLAVSEVVFEVASVVLEFVEGFVFDFPSASCVVEQCYVGRNCDMFNAVRTQFAYKQVRNFTSQGDFMEACVEECVVYTNAHHRYPLPYAECLYTGKSISRWSWKYTGEGGLPLYTPEESERGRVNGLAKRRQKAQPRSTEILNLYFDDGLGYRRIESNTGIPLSTVRNVVKDYFKQQPAIANERLARRIAKPKAKNGTSNRRKPATDRNINAILSMYFDECLGYMRIASKTGIPRSTVRNVVRTYFKQEPYTANQRLQRRMDVQYNKNRGVCTSCAGVLEVFFLNMPNTAIILIPNGSAD